ncbi:MAG: phosphoribosylanthranilate isomerase [Deltaproteobacteria bacterium]|nr:phosphoribosylanthranilate isomerase [Deltaproteobacteria bacterium]MBW1967071.1 phosphoribosylanthranilate isomerase [Deltaproteobacteria bacterium]MBW2097719.1 phosphoribosylanthranilate isomerase [Deltaproteobacteria bacterium]PXF56099.1 MAG: phosphoribosylanthranilate isomerase [Deltaproteobacteria bacterium]
MVKIKVCGLTDPSEAKAVAEAGANAIGLVFAKSPRQIYPDRAREIVQNLPPMVQTVGVFVNESPEKIRQITDYCGLDLVQLHGEETPEICRELAPRAIKAWRIRTEADIQALLPYQEVVKAFLLDAWSPGAHGGTGETFDWSIAIEAKKVLSRPIILAGGLRPENVAGAVKQVRPWGVDVSSGVENAPGKKNIGLVAEFIRRATLD